MNPVSPFGLTTPIFNYEYVRSRAALIEVSAGTPDPHIGPRAALCQSARRRMGAADDRHLAHPFAEGLRNRSRRVRPMDKSSSSSKARSWPKSATRPSPSAKAISASYRLLDGAASARHAGGDRLFLLRPQRAGEARHLARAENVRVRPASLQQRPHFYLRSTRSPQGPRVDRPAKSPQSSGSTLTIAAPWLEPTQRTGRGPRLVDIDTANIRWFGEQILGELAGLDVQPIDHVGQHGA